MYVGDKIVTMTKSLEVLEKAWQQLEVENPDSIFRLRKLKANQNTNDGKKGKRDFPQPKIIASSNHIEHIFKELTDPGFAYTFGDVTLVFKDGDCVPYYRSILSLISIEFRMLFQLYSYTDLVILTGISKEEFFGEVFKEDDASGDPNTLDIVNDSLVIQNQHENKEFLKQTRNIGKIRRRNTFWCDICEKKIVDLKRHKDEVHTKSRAFQSCSHCDYSCDRKYDLNRHRKTCRRDPANGYNFTCPACGKKFQTKKQQKRHSADASRCPNGRGDMERNMDEGRERMEEEYLRRHTEDVHTKSKTVYSCHHCDYSCDRKNDLNRHRKTCRSDPANGYNFPCPSCGRRFLTKKKQKHHSADAHRCPLKGRGDMEEKIEGGGKGGGALNEKLLLS